MKLNARAAGFTLVELLIVLVIGAIVLGATYQTLTTQEKSNRHQIAIVSAQQNMRAGLDVLLSELRETSATGGDLLEATPTSVRFRALRKAGVVCGRDAAITRDWADVALIGETFATTDSIVVFSDGTNKNSYKDDTWITPGPPSSVSTPSGTCAGNPIGTSIRRLRFAAGVLVNVDTGAVVRSYDNIAYQIVDNNEMGHITRTIGTQTDTIIQSLATTANNGLRFRYFNQANTQIDPTTAALRATVMRIEIMVKGRSIGGGAGATREFQDSLIGQLYLRGNQKTT